MLVTVNIILRYFFNHPINWVEEVVCYAFIWLGYLAVSYTLSMDAHVRFTLVLDKAPAKAHAAICLALDVLVAAVFIVLYPSMLKCFGFMYETPSLRIWQGYFFMIVPVGYILIIYHSIVNIISRFHPDKVDMTPLIKPEDSSTENSSKGGAN